MTAADAYIIGGLLVAMVGLGFAALLGKFDRGRS